MYDPAISKDWKQHVRVQAAQHMRGEAMFAEGPLTMGLSFELLRPLSAPKRVTRPTTRPDLDNLAKAVKDALQGVCYRNDAQIVELTLDKHFGPVPGVSVAIERVIS